MKNWNTDVSKFKSHRAKRLWELVQLINYGLDGEKLDALELKNNWEAIRKLLDPRRRRMIEYLLWEKVSSPNIKSKFWGLSPKTNS